MTQPVTLAIPIPELPTPDRPVYILYRDTFSGYVGGPVLAHCPTCHHTLFTVAHDPAGAAGWPYVCIFCHTLTLARETVSNGPAMRAKLAEFNAADPTAEPAVGLVISVKIDLSIYPPATMPAR